MSCPHLENCKINLPVNLDVCFENVLRDAPLKSLELQINTQQGHPDIPELLLTFSHFGRTLEDLYIGYWPYPIEGEVAFQDNTWMVRVNLPKLTTVWICSYYGNLDFLLTLPSLRKLYLINCRQGFLRPPSPHLLKLPRSRRDKFKTNVWSHLTRLRYLYVWRRDPFEPFSVTRSEHEQYVKDKENASVFTNLLSYLPFFGN